MRQIPIPFIAETPHDIPRIACTYYYQLFVKYHVRFHGARNMKLYRHRKAFLSLHYFVREHFTKRSVLIRG